MKPPRVVGEAAVPDMVNKLIREFKYRDADTIAGNPMLGGGGGMAHILIVSTSEPQFVQAKADYVVNATNAGPQLNAIFDSLPDTPWSIWMAGVFIIDEDVFTPAGSWIRGLGYTSGTYG